MQLRQIIWLFSYLRFCQVRSLLQGAGYNGRYLPKNMNQKLTNIFSFLQESYAGNGFELLTNDQPFLPSNIEWIGGIEKKNINIHRAISLVSYSGTQEQFNSCIFEFKKALQKNLKARFWRGLGIGLIINSILHPSIFSSRISMWSKACL